MVDKPMLTPAGLVDALGILTGVARATVVDIDRKLVAAGLRTKGGRGLSAPRMTALDSAHLMTALLAVRQANQSAAAVQRYRATEADANRSTEGFYTATGLGDLALPDRHSFVDALAALVHSAARGALRELIATSGADARPQIEMFAFTRATYGRIRVYALPDGRSAHVEYLPSAVPTMRKSRTPPPLGMDLAAGDLEQSCRLTERTLFGIADRLAEENESDRN